MFSFIRKLNLMQWYSVFMLSWFTLGRQICLYLTDETARNFLHNPVTFIIAIITAIYAIIISGVYTSIKDRSQSFKNHLGDANIIIAIPHIWFMIYRGYIFMKYNQIADFGYLLLDASFVLYFIIIYVACMQTNSNNNRESNIIATCN